MQSILNKSLTQSSQGNMNMGKLIDEINASNRFIQHLVKEKNRSDSLNLVMVNKLTRIHIPLRALCKTLIQDALHIGQALA
jgi:chemotaxis protein MotB